MRQMAFWKNSYYGKPKKQKRRKHKKVEYFAYMYGMVNRGLRNPESRVSEAFRKGRETPKQQVKRSLF